jgi:hypothetical protein
MDHTLDAFQIALKRQFRVRDAEKLVGLSTRQILHAGQFKLKFPDWNTGKGNPRLLSIVELFQLRLLSAVDQRVPIKAIQPLADLGRGYLGAAFTDPVIRSKPAVVVGYPTTKGSWFWLLGIDSKWPENPPPPSTEILIVVRIREILGQLMKGVIEHFRESDEEAVMLPPATFVSSLSADLRHAATVGAT